jgi:hypothetical protein
MSLTIVMEINFLICKVDSGLTKTGENDLDIIVKFSKTKIKSNIHQKVPVYTVI